MRPRDTGPEPDKLDELRLRRAIKLMRCGLTRAQERKLARECGLPVAELRARAAS